MVTLGQELKMQKHMLKTFLQDIAVVLCRKRLQKTSNIRKMRPFENWQKWPPSKGYITFAKWSLWVKNWAVVLCIKRLQKTAQKLKMQKTKNMLQTFLQDIAVVLCKKRLQKTANIRKMRPF